MQRRRVVEGLIAAVTVAGALLLWLLGNELDSAMILVAVGAVLIAVVESDGRQRHAVRAEVARVRSELAALRKRQEKALAEQRTFRAAQDEAAQAYTQVLEHAATEIEHVGTELATVRRLVEDQGDRSRARQTELRRSFRELKHKPLTQMQSLNQLQSWFTPSAPLPSVGGWAMEPTTLVEIVDLITRLRPTVVLECGSGTSTIWVTQALRRNGQGRVISLEHDGDYASATRGHLARHSLDSWADVRHAPLVPTQTDEGELDWYDVDTAALPQIDLLIVDGPPKATGDIARYPALPVLTDQMGPNAVIVLDDADREGEQEIVRLWREHHGVRWSQNLVGRALVLGLGEPPPAA